MMRRRIASSIILMFFFTAFNASGQSDILKSYQQVAVPSPEAASMAKHVEMPVSYFNGVPEISIPLYEIVEGDIHVPIVLRYHANGIRVNEESSWVGLGWSLDAGGSIAHEVNNIEDYKGFLTQPLAPPDDGGAFDDFRDDARYVPVGISDGGNTSTCRINGTTVFPLGQATAMDGEPDLYMYDFAGHSGKYIFTSPTSGYSLKRDNIKIALHGPSGLQAITDDGFEYTFDQYEFSTNLHDATNDLLALNAYSDPTNTSYNITHIKSPLGRSVDFLYPPLPSFGAYNWNNVNANKGVRTMNFHFSKTNKQYQTLAETTALAPEVSYSESYGALLDRINFSHGYIKFIKSSRSDLMNGFKLDEIQVYNSDNTLFRRYVFNYDYFQGDLSYGDQYSNHTGPLVASYTANFRQLRLELLSVDEVSPDNEKLTHKFTYSNTPLPYKTSFASDYWGYFNGATTNTTLLPSGQDLQQYYSLPDDFVSFIGARREANALTMQAGILTQIDYPQGGSTKFTYESNSFTNTFNRKSLLPASATDFNPLPENPNSMYNSPLSGEFTISAQTVKLSYSFNFVKTINYPTCVIQPPSCMWVSIEQKSGTNWIDKDRWYFTAYTDLLHQKFVDGNSLSLSDDLTVSLPDGTYRLHAHYPSEYNGNLPYENFAKIDVSYFVSEQVTQPMTGGGLRISKIEYVDPIENKSWRKKYSYSGGVNMNLPQFTYENTILYPSITCGGFSEGCCPDATCQSMGSNHISSIYSDNIVRYSNSADGSPVGYDGVTVEFDGVQNGKTQYFFNVRSSSLPAWAPPGVPTDNILDNGTMVFKTDYKFENNQYVKVKEIENSYKLVNRKLQWGFKVENNAPLLNCPNNLGISTYSCAVCGALTYHYYPIRMANVVVDVSHERTYTSEGNFEVTTTNSYNQNGYLAAQQITGSDGKLSLVEHKYPTDYTITSVPWIADLVNKNMVNSPLETLKKVNGNVIGGNFIQYKTSNNITTPNVIYRIENTTPKPIASSAPTAILPIDFKIEGAVEYDANGNISYTQRADNVITSYIWGYNHNLPIAVIQNALPAQVFYTSFEELTTADATTIARTGTTGCKAAFTVPLPSAGTYILTYWKQVAGIWQYIQDTMSANKQIGGGANEVIDEVRVYPAGSLMTTYTYNPLYGATSKTDQNGNTNFYEYDNFARLKLVRDKDNKIINQYKYHYKGN